MCQGAVIASGKVGDKRVRPVENSEPGERRSTKTSRSLWIVIDSHVEQYTTLPIQGTTVSSKNV